MRPDRGTRSGRRSVSASAWSERRPTARLPTHGVHTHAFMVEDDAVEGALTHPAHRRVAVDVVPHGAHGLFERPRLAWFPLEIVAGEGLAEVPPRLGLEEMPGGDEVERGVGRSESTDIEDPGQSPAGHEQVPRSQVPMGHEIGIVARKLAQVSPHAADWRRRASLRCCRNTAPSTHRGIAGHPRGQPREPTATRVEGADVGDELRQIIGEPSRGSRILVCCSESRQPRLYRPGQRIAGPGLADGDRLGDWEAGAPEQLTGRVGLGQQPLPRRRDVPMPGQRESCGDVIPDPEDRVDGPLR